MIYQVEDVLRTVASQVSQAFQISSYQLRLGRDLATEGYWCHGAVGCRQRNVRHILPLVFTVFIVFPTRRKANSGPLWHHWPRRRWHHSCRHCLRAQSRCHSEPWPQDVTALSRLFACITASLLNDVDNTGFIWFHCCVFLVDLAIRQMQLCCNALSLG